jgi:hypothetical protein
VSAFLFAVVVAGTFPIGSVATGGLLRITEIVFATETTSAVETSERTSVTPPPMGGRRAPAHRFPAVVATARRAYGAVVALEMSVLPKFAGQSPSGHGAGNTRWPALNDAWRHASMAGQSAVFGASVQTPAP